MKTNKEKSSVELLMEMFRLASVGDILRQISDCGTDADPIIHPFVSCTMDFDPTIYDDYWMNRFHEINEMDMECREKAQQYYDDLKKWAIKENVYHSKNIIKGVIADELLYRKLTKPFEDVLKGLSANGDSFSFEPTFLGCGTAYAYMGFPLNGEFDSDEKIVGILDGIFDKYAASKEIEDIEKGGTYEYAEKIYNEWMAAIEDFEWVENDKLSTT